MSYGGLWRAMMWSLKMYKRGTSTHFSSSIARRGPATTAQWTPTSCMRERSATGSPTHGGPSGSWNRISGLRSTKKKEKEKERKRKKKKDVIQGKRKRKEEKKETRKEIIYNSKFVTIFLMFSRSVIEFCFL
eukprot:Rmarinus@m.19909